MTDGFDIAVADEDDEGHRCPYCGEENKTEEHILDCQPHKVSV